MSAVSFADLEVGFAIGVVPGGTVWQEEESRQQDMGPCDRATDSTGPSTASPGRPGRVDGTKVRRRRRRTVLAAAPSWCAALTDAQWQRIVPLLPKPKATGRRRSTDLRGVVTAINLHWQTGCPWRKLPPDLPPWPTVYTYFRAWFQDGTLRKIRTILDPPKTSEVTPPLRYPKRPPAKLNPDRPTASAFRFE